MKELIKKIILVALLAFAAWYLWSHRDRIESLSNFNVMVQGNWRRVKMDFKEPTVYTFTESFISVDGQEWASYRLIQRTRIEISTAGEFVIYELSFPDDDNMVWSTRKGEKLVPSVRWRR